ncbi:serine protease 96 precursor [Nasonia vitripennis]|uniref:Peptidase S1 domain-containing protein n=1 Tax=Nasonia vitripennis TaxID=7425 RepID=A0A7M6W5N5_NASVI|nr:serine protease 96 precursor [Nasonia vitripennis]
MKCLLIFAVCCLALAKSQQFWFPIIQYYPIDGNFDYPSIVPIQPILPIQPIVPSTPRYADNGEYPYQVAIQVDGKAHCGGTLISKKHVLTAAHCTHDWIQQGKDKRTIKVIAGTSVLDGSGTVLRVANVSQHQHFGQQSESSAILINDIAIITLTQEIKESSTVKIIKLPPDNFEIGDNTQVMVSGFGTTELGGPPSRKLKSLYMSVTNPSICATNWQNRGSVTVAHICAKPIEEFGACEGDSGGPLVLADKSTIVGIVSQGIGLGCKSGWPDLYTRVSYYLDWINSQIALTS